MGSAEEAKSARRFEFDVYCFLASRSSTRKKEKAGQTLNVSISSDENNAVFQIYSPGEKQTLSGAGETDDAMNWSGKVPADGEYVIVVGPTRGNATYKLTYSLK